jgi:tetratricopeptide (TPR) repeat protein
MPPTDDRSSRLPAASEPDRADGRDIAPEEPGRNCPEPADELGRPVATRARTVQPAGAALTVPFDGVDTLCREFIGAWDGARPDLHSYLSRIIPFDRPALLRNLLEYEVRKRRQAGDAPSAKDYIDRLPPEYAELVRCVFLDASGVSLSAAHEPTPPADWRGPAASRLGEYRLVREIGRGGMGAVYEAVHLGRGHRVALKTLPAVGGDSLHRFKREFRALADVTHPNLVGLRTLESDGAQWFLTMDLLDGCDFLSYVRPGGRPDESRLRAALAQLAAGVMALHARGVVHRDLKPGNVMVTAGGRLVILDFGLVAELGRAGALTVLGGMAGTPAYMAPEQAAGATTGPPADWYAVGVMLYEGMCGARPFEGEVLRVLQDKQLQDAPPLPGGLGTPADLAGLCAGLLARDPNARPDPLLIAGAVAAAVPASLQIGSADKLIGREPQLAAFAEALAALRRTREPVTVLISGRSGEGKTSLAEAFLSSLRRDPSLVVMSGRCYDRESVPFKALDTLVDALTSHLRSVPAADAALLLPDDVGLLAELFPVLRRCEVVAKAPRGRLDALDQQQVRQRAFAALRLLLERIGERTPLVCFVDDLQWGDADSASALFEVLRPPAAPAVLLLGSFRSDEADASPFLTEWAARRRQNGIEFGDRAVSVGPLSLEEATQLVVNVVGRDDEEVRRRAVQFHAQAGGNPFLLTELAGCFDPDTDTFHATDIHGVLARKLNQLPAEAGPLLQAVSVSGQAVELGEAAAAAGLAEPPEEALTRMRNARLLRVVGAKVDTYHDRIRYAVQDRMPDDSRRGMHRRLAEVIEGAGGALPDEEIDTIAGGETGVTARDAMGRVYDLSYHYDAAGDRKRALAYALLAAGQARAQYALDVAIQQYTVAHRNADATPRVVRFRIARGKGEALMQVGRYEDARKELEAAHALAEGLYEIADVRGLQGDLAYKLGFISESMDYLTDALQRLGVNVPRTQLGLWWGLITEPVVQTFHSLLPGRLHRRKPDPNADLANRLLGKLEYDYYFHNVLHLLWASLVGLNQAERLPPSSALAFNQVTHANNMAVLGWHSRAARYYQAAFHLSKKLNDEWGAAHAINHISLGCLSAARYEETIANATPGTVAFGKLGDLLEVHHAHFNIGLACYGLGRIKDAIEKAKWVFESSVRHGDNVVAPVALCLWSRASRGQLPIDELIHCVQVFQGNSNATISVLMAEGYWHTHRKETGKAVESFERAWTISRNNTYIVAFNSWVLSDFVTSLRLHAEAIELRNRAESKPVRQRLRRLAKWSVRLSWFLPPERPRALRELSLVYANRGRTKKAWALAAKSCRIAENQKAMYEHAKSLLVQGQLAKQLGRPEADDQLRDAQSEIERIEGAVSALSPPLPV